MTNWGQVDWTESDKALSLRLGVSRQRVQQKRRAVGAPAAARDLAGARVARQPIEELTVRELAEASGACRGTIYAVTRQLGRRPKVPKAPAPLADRLRELPLERLTVREIAAAVGRGCPVVYQTLARHGLPFRKVKGLRALGDRP